MPRSIRSSIILFAIAAMCGACGCQSKQPAQPAPYIHKSTAAAPTAKDPVATITNTDPCAGQLHDISEPLLLYYLKNHRLPGRLEELRAIPGFESIDLTCPVSKRPYLYNPIGLTTAENRARIICYDPAPSHSGMRWAISIIEPEDDNGPLVTKVIALPESHFTFMGR
ncbi:MAG: hypothetical protein JWN40_3481 [Phycisphaerales bacterium]|nr:hypothetical protein [Phycisphaerales bacterium]